MNVLSCFDGMSGAQIALERLGITIDNYYASEIDKYAMAVTQYHYPNTTQLGDITKWKTWDINLSEIDLLVAGFSCQPWSFAGKQKGLDDQRGQLSLVLFDLFEEYKKQNPNGYFLFENVKMKKENLEFFNNLFGVNCIHINSALVSAQNRQRVYWTNIPGIEQPEDKGIVLKDIIECGVVDRNKSYPVLAACASANLDRYENKHTYNVIFSNNDYLERNNRIYYAGSVVNRKINPETGNREDTNSNIKAKSYVEVAQDVEKARCLTTIQTTSVLTAQESGRHESDKVAWRKLTPLECERLQTVDDNWTLVPHPVYKDKMMSDSQRYKMLGNGFTIDVICHILSYIDIQK